jgi:hypothetical protein
VKITGNDADYLEMIVPVVGHIISGTVGHFVIEGYGKVEGALIPFFLVIQVFHPIAPIKNE